jgi:ABC-2 type transport system ATP-binding protein
MSIQVDGITKLYGEQLALDNVSFRVNTGEVVGFIGPNGAGKSTMMKIITGYIPQTKGEVRVNDLNTLEHSLEIRKMTGYLPENNPLYVEMYIREYLTMVANLYAIKGAAARKVVDDMIGRVGLGPEQHKKIGALSKGYRQRVGLAQALIHDPSVLILDEPTSGLDPNQIIEIRDFIHSLAKRKTILLSTHIMQEVEAICDRVVIINLGKIVADETTAELRKRESSLEKVFQKLTIDTGKPGRK